MVVGFVWIAAVGQPVAGFEAADAAAAQVQAQAMLEPIPIAEVLGPLAPVALSPFFGITCLSGTSILVSQGVLPENRFLKGNRALNNPVVFGSFLVLTILTSLPRLSKVSKPFAQLVDQLETYAAILMVLVVHWAARSGGAESPELVQAGMFTASLETFLVVASVINIVVINAVKFFFELAILISPVPVIDALFEVMNKAVCIVLAAVYAFNPMVAFAVNILIFLVCLLVFGWARRKTGYYRGMTLEPLWAMLRKHELHLSADALPHRLREDWPDAELVVEVFPDERVGKIKSFARSFLVRSGDQEWLVHGKDREALPAELSQAGIDEGLLGHAIEWPEGNLRLVFSRRYSAALGRLGEMLKQS